MLVLFGDGDGGRLEGCSQLTISDERGADCMFPAAIDCNKNCVPLRKICREMKHCVLITAYKDPKQINRLIGRIPQDWGIFIHIDKKSAICDGEIDSRAIKINRRNIYWGSFAHVEAFLDMMRIALTDERQFDYFHLITAQDYPAIDLRKVDDLITPGKIYMRHEPIPRSCWPSWDGGFQFYRYNTFARWTDVRFPFYNRALNRLCKIFQFWKTKRYYLPPYPIEGGSSYMSISRKAAEVLTSSDISKDLQRRLRHSLDGEETFYQTAIMNSELKDDVINDDMRLIIWPGPAVLDESHIDIIRSCKKIFIRKMESGTSDKLMDMLDKMAGQSAS